MWYRLSEAKSKSASSQSQSRQKDGWRQCQVSKGRTFFPSPPLPSSFKLTNKYGLLKSQQSAGQIPLAANVQPNGIHKETHTQKKALSRCRAVIHLEIPGDESYTQSWDLQKILSQMSLVKISGSQNPSHSVIWGESVSHLLFCEFTCRDFMIFCRCQKTKAASPQS